MSPQQPNPPPDLRDGDAAGTPARASPGSHVHGAMASHSLPPPPDAYGETWLDFLRQSGPDHTLHRDRPGLRHAETAPDDGMMERATTSTQHLPRLDSLAVPRAAPSRPESSSSRSSERKRRLTTAESPMRRPSSVRMHSSAPGGSNTDPILIQDSPGPSLPRNMSPLPPLPAQSRRESDLVLPPWQPDAQVSRCPVCSRHFTFLFRKHHCRKCGRVVCATCSPHRITIPRQFIVHPPSDSYNTVDPSDDIMTAFGPFRNPALGGGEEVRVCNPCVPDPNFSPPPQYSPHSHAYAAPRRPSASTSTHSHSSSQRSHRASASVHNAPTQQAARPRDTVNGRRVVSYHQSTQSQDRWPSPFATTHAYTTQTEHTSIPPRRNSGVAHPHRQPQTGASPNPFFDPTQPSQRHRPRRQIPEEDECPICGLELPPKGPDGDDSARAQHIEDCIADHSASPAPRPQLSTGAQTSASLPIQRTRGMSSAGAGSSSNRHSHATRGMFPYTATEKDCVDDEGKEAECVICFEEFEAGDKLARLVCWCKFHETCIKQWWEKKGRGACPTHQLHE